MSGTSTAASPPYVVLPSFVRVVSSPFFFYFFFRARLRGARRLRGAMPCYPHDVRRVNCYYDQLATAFYSEIDEPIVRARFLAPPPPPRRSRDLTIEKPILTHWNASWFYVKKNRPLDIDFFLRTYIRTLRIEISVTRKWATIFFFFSLVRETLPSINCLEC